MYRITLAFPFLLQLHGVLGFDLDVDNEASVKDVAGKLANGIVTAYKNYLQPGKTIGLFSDDGKPPAYWWSEAGLAWNSLVEYSYLTGDKQYDDVVSQALVWQVGEKENAAYMPANQTKNLGNDDQAVWGLAALTAAETGFKEPANIKWLDLAKQVFDVQAMRWDDTCGGGLRWQIFTFSNGYDYKSSATNAAFFLLSARLAALTGNKTYSDWAEKSYKWSRDVGLITDALDILDGADSRSNCSALNKVISTYTHGMYVEGAAVLNALGNNTNFPAESLATRFRNNFIPEDTKVIVESACEELNTCGRGQKYGKGVAARSLSRAGATWTSVSNSLDTYLRESAKNAAQGCEGQGSNVTCGYKWAGKNTKQNNIANGGLPEVLNALSAVQSRLYKKAGANRPQGGSPVINPSGNPSGGNQTVAPSGTPTGSKSPPRETGAAGRVTVAWIGATLAAMLFAAGM